ncbi:MAG: CDGSH iron-sulfur domain-containing protein [Anaerolineae bacterium]
MRRDGPYLVLGGIPLVRKIQVVSEYGEPLTWQKGERWDAGEIYSLCRCGQSREKPFCDSTHLSIDFDGKETADTASTANRQRVYPGGTHIVAKHDDYLCMNAGFCANRVTTIQDMVPETSDTAIRSQVIAMIERCPSGSLTYAIEAGQPDIEPDLPQQVAVVTEITCEGPIAGPLWVTGGIPTRRADGLALETRNRVTLCRCGRSRKKPLCDGSHRTAR